MAEQEYHIVREGKAEILFAKDNVFYSPVQQFNRDLSIAVLRVFAEQYGPQKTNDTDSKGLSVLEALSASGLRSIRYAKEIPDILDRILANDMSQYAVDCMQRNVEHNKLPQGKMTPHMSDAIDLLYSQKTKREFDVIDIDPFGSAAPFVDGTVQAVKDGGLLCITCTDMAVLAGNNPTSCFAKYGSIPVKTPACHELALRILLNFIKTCAAKYKRHIEPLLSVSVDYYVRVFVRVHDNAAEALKLCASTSTLYQCCGCKSYELAPFGTFADPSSRGGAKFSYGRLPAGMSDKCSQCDAVYHIGGPVYSGPIHNQEFVRALVDHLNQESSSALYGTYERMLGMISVISEELPDVPLFYTVDKLCQAVRVSCPPMVKINSAILNAGYRVSMSHCHQHSLKTDAPIDVLMDILRCLKLECGPIKLDKFPDKSVQQNLLRKEPKLRADFTIHPDANPQSRKFKLNRFEDHKGMNWGPRSKKAVKRKLEIEADSKQSQEQSIDH
ncbi:hypothetical protein MP228_009950 [Amoeboaphelidium protococcarum]|nr:hypothetical protein MP228_009950 [Amoeboaphelidium protococcarum]